MFLKYYSGPIMICRTFLLPLPIIMEERETRNVINTLAACKGSLIQSTS